MESKKVRYPIGVQSFEELRREGYIYIDKTGYIPELLQNKYYFMSRPRRFGKSLLLSTLEAYFRGQKNLFEGLAIGEQEKEWIEYPIVHIDFNSMNASDTTELLCALRRRLSEIAEEYGIHVRNKDIAGIGEYFTNLIKGLSIEYGRNVVVLIDEYDKGIIEVLHDESLREKAANELRPFFSVLKSADRYIRFAFVTGVSRFRNTTIFSGANNLFDISLDERFAGMLGVTEVELQGYFQDEILFLSQKYRWPKDKLLKVMLNRYDGYRFTAAPIHVCNPFSLLSMFASGRFADFWVASGTSKILAVYLRNSHFSLQDLTDRWVSETNLTSTYSTDDPLSLFFQTGYLTIRDYDGADFYQLGIPNQEVQTALVQLLIPEFVNVPPKEKMSDLQRRLRKTIAEGDVDGMMSMLRSLLSMIPYHDMEVKLMEKHLHLCIYVIFLMLGTDTKCEIAEAAGRVDMVAATPWKVYVFEFKLDESAEEALRQIDDKGYAIPWEADDRDVYKIGVNFSSSLRTIDSWKTTVTMHF